jgi:hypothetical protein
MQQVLETTENGLDIFNYHAIELLELLGQKDPHQLEIDVFEEKLRNIFLANS